MKNRAITKSITPDAEKARWVKLKKYVAMTGDSAAAVHARRRSRKWSDGDQCKIVDDALWVDLDAVTKWLESWNA